MKTWTEACEWIFKNESRVRLEQQRISGEEFYVWRWIQDDSTGTYTVEPMKTAESGVRPSLAEEGVVSSSSREKNWYSGTTFDDDSGRSTGRNNRLNSAYGAPSLCIRLKNMFEAVR